MNFGYESTFRVIAYSSGSTALFYAVPFCGGLVAFIWSLVVQIIGVKEIHGTTTGTAVMAVLLPFLVCCCGFAGLMALLVALLVGTAGGGF